MDTSLQRGGDQSERYSFGMSFDELILFQAFWLKLYHLLISSFTI